MNKNQNISIQDFLSYFPEVELPVILGENTHVEFSKRNAPISQKAIHQFIQPIEIDFDEYTEIVPCFRVPATHEFHAVVYWKAGLMNYQYIMLTFGKKGGIIDRAVVAGVHAEGAKVTQSVATLDEDWMIYIVSGQQDGDGKKFDSRNSTKVELELLPDGKISSDAF